jgi:hypothetical protein
MTFFRIRGSNLTTVWLVWRQESRRFFFSAFSVLNLLKRDVSVRLIVLQENESEWKYSRKDFVKKEAIVTSEKAAAMADP